MQKQSFRHGMTVTKLGMESQTSGSAMSIPAPSSFDSAILAGQVVESCMEKTSLWDIDITIWLIRKSHLLRVVRS